MKSRNPIILAALVIAMMAVAACSSGPSAKEAYEIFTLVMDKTAGTGNWTAKDHDMKSGVLVVNGVTVKLPPMGFTMDENGQTTKATESKSLEIATVELKNPLDKPAVEKIFAAPDWRNQKEAKLADSLVLKGLSLKGLPLGMGASDMTAEEISFASVALKASGAEAPAGKAGFLKALSLGNLSYKNFKVSTVVEVPDQGTAKSSSVIELVTMDGVAFDGEPLAGLEALDPSGFFTTMTSMSAKSAVLKNMVMDISDDKNVKGTVTVANVEEKGVRPLGAIDSFVMDGFKFDLTGLDKKLDISMGLTKMTMNGFDMSGYIRKFVPFLIASTQDPEAASEALMNVQTLGDFLVAPFSVNDAVMSGLEFKIGDLLGFKMAEAKVTGPYKTGEIPLSQKTSVTGVEIFLPSSDPGDLEGFKDMYEFTKYFGMSRFEMDIEAESSYDPASGVWKNQTSKFAVKDLFDLTGGLEFGGLTAERVEKLKTTPLNSMLFVMMAPEAVLGDMAVNGLTIKLADKGLVNRSFKFAAAMEAEDPNVDAAKVETLKTQAISMLDLAITLGGGQYLENPGELAKSLKDFLTTPGNLEIKLAADPPLSYKAVESMAGDTNKILNSLNISVSANDKAAPALKFAIPTYSPSQGAAPGSDPWGDDEDDEE